MRHKVSRDKGHAAIVAELKARGYSVADLAGAGNDIPDLVVANSSHTVFIEIKESGGQFYLRQLAFIAAWKGYAAFVATSEQAVAVMEHPEVNCLSGNDKRRITSIVYRAQVESDRWHAERGRSPLRNPQMKVTAFDKLFKKVD